MKLPQLTLRDLFWLVLVVALGCAWWSHARQATADIRRERRQLDLEILRRQVAADECAKFLREQGYSARTQDGYVVVQFHSWDKVLDGEP
jgi:hypothetical protein